MFEILLLTFNFGLVSETYIPDFCHTIYGALCWLPVLLASYSISTSREDVDRVSKP